jgi:hypothetical protein
VVTDEELAWRPLPEVEAGDWVRAFTVTARDVTGE